MLYGCDCQFTPLSIRHIGFSQLPTPKSGFHSPFPLILDTDHGYYVHFGIKLHANAFSHSRRRSMLMRESHMIRSQVMIVSLQPAFNVSKYPTFCFQFLIRHCQLPMDTGNSHYLFLETNVMKISKLFRDEALPVYDKWGWQAYPRSARWESTQHADS